MFFLFLNISLISPS